jgi:hypothetical protein
MTDKPIRREALERLMRELAQLQKAGAVNSRPRNSK